MNKEDRRLVSKVLLLVLGTIDLLYQIALCSARISVGFNVGAYLSAIFCISCLVCLYVELCRDNSDAFYWPYRVLNWFRIVFTTIAFVILVGYLMFASEDAKTDLVFNTFRGVRVSERTVMQIQFNLLPCIAAVLLIIPIIFLIIGASGDDKGWATSSNCDLGWKQLCCGGCSDLNSDAIVHTAGLGHDLYNGGNCAIAGSIIGLLLTLIALVVAVLVVIGLGPFFIICLADAIFLLVICFIVTIMWIVWVGVTKDDRDKIDNGMDPDYAFGLEIVASIFLIISSVLLFVSLKFPIRLFGNTASS